MRSSEYRNGEPWRGRSVLVVGFGNSACEQALDLIEHGAAAHLAVRSPVNAVPRDVFAQSRSSMCAAPGPSASEAADALSWPIVRLARGDLRRLGLRPFRTERSPRSRATAGSRSSTWGRWPRSGPAGSPFIPGSTTSPSARSCSATESRWRWTRSSSRPGIGRPRGVPARVEGGLRRGGLSEALRRAERAPGLYFCGMYILPAGMFPAIGLEAARIAKSIDAARRRSGSHHLCGVSHTVRSGVGSITSRVIAAFDDDSPGAASTCAQPHQVVVPLSVQVALYLDRIADPEENHEKHAHNR